MICCGLYHDRLDILHMFIGCHTSPNHPVGHGSGLKCLCLKCPRVSATKFAMWTTTSAFIATRPLSIYMPCWMFLEVSPNKKGGKVSELVMKKLSHPAHRLGTRVVQPQWQCERKVGHAHSNSCRQKKRFHVRNHLSPPHPVTYTILTCDKFLTKCERDMNFTS